MNLTLALYLIDVLENAKTVVGFSIFLAIAIAGICTIEWATAYDEESKPKKLKYAKIFIGIAMLLSVFATLIPDKNTMYLMLGAETTKEIVKNPEVKEIGNRILGIVNDKLDELSEKHEKEKIMGMFNEVHKNCPFCSEKCTVQIAQVVGGFGDFDLDDPQDIRNKTTLEERMLLKEYVDDSNFYCAVCEKDFNITVFLKENDNAVQI